MESLSVCLFVSESYLVVDLSVYLDMYMLVYVRLLVRLFGCLQVSTAACRSDVSTYVTLSVCIVHALDLWLVVGLPVCLFIYLSLCLSYVDDRGRWHNQIWLGVIIATKCCSYCWVYQTFLSRSCYVVDCPRTPFAATGEANRWNETLKQLQIKRLVTLSKPVSLSRACFNVQ